MKRPLENEAIAIIIAIAVISLVMGLQFIIISNFEALGIVILFAFITIAINVIAKKAMAYHLDADVKHEIWHVKRYGFVKSNTFKSPAPMGIILPLFFSLFSVGAAKVFTILTYETRPLKRRAAKRHGLYSFTEITEWHNALIGAAGIIATLLVAFISYWFPGLELLSKTAAYYAFWNMIPISKLDGTQIYFGSRVLWTTLAAITLVVTLIALLII